MCEMMIKTTHQALLIGIGLRTLPKECLAVGLSLKLCGHRANFLIPHTHTREREGERERGTDNKISLMAMCSCYRQQLKYLKNVSLLFSTTITRYHGLFQFIFIFMISPCETQFTKALAEFVLHTAG